MLLSGVTSGKEIKAHETPLKTRLEWTNSANKVKHQADWASGFKSRYWASEWWHSDRYLYANVSEPAPNVYWGDYTKKLSKRKEIANAIAKVVPPKTKLKIDFDSKFDCSSFTCVPFLYVARISQWRCMYFRNSDFASIVPKSEGIVGRDKNNSSILKGYFCNKNSNITPEEATEMVDSFYYKRP